MAAEVVPPLRQRKKPSGFMNQLSSAFCEWFLIFLLFIDAAFSYFLAKFAHYCELKTPCLLCSRLDHVFSKNKSYTTLLCNSHREEISTLASCSIHGKLSDIHGMCEECLTPIALQNKSNNESYRLLVGKLWVDVERTVLQNLLLNKHVRLGSSPRRTCSCCNKTWRTKSNTDRLLELTPIGYGASKANVKPPLPHVPGRSRFSRRDSLKRLRDKFTGTGTTITTTAQQQKTADKLSHVGYTKLKISSDSESEAPVSEDEDEGNAISSRGRNYYRNEARFRRRSLSGKPIGPMSSEKKKPEEVRKSDQPNLLDLSEEKTVVDSSSEALVEHSLRELNWEEACIRHGSISTEELISLDDGPKLLEEVSESNDASLPHMSAISVLSELLSLYNAPSLSNTLTISKNTINLGENIEKENTMPEKTINLGGNIEKENIIPEKTINIEENIEKENTIPEKTINVDENTKKENTTPENTINLGENIEKENTSPQKDLEASSKTSSNVACPLEANDTNLTDISTQNIEKMELLPEQAVNTRDSAKMEEDTNPVQESSVSEAVLSSKDTEKHEELRKEEDSRAQDLPVLPSMKRNDSSYESLDGMSVTDIEGESILDRLKRQAEHDRSTMASLYKELEEERNAAAVAANQAMAMITRLQEEKAALHMEALQYLRMMEEQAEYDMEALERANDLLAEKEKELQDLETEIEFYRNNFVQESVVNKNDYKSSKILKDNEECEQKEISVSNFEDEKIFILECLKKLEKKLHGGRLNHDLPNGVYSENSEDSNQENDENGSSISGSNGNSTHDKRVDCFYEKKDIFEKEIAELHDRLEALEIERDVLKHASNLLPNGKDGLRLIQEIAHQLRALRETDFRKR